MASTAFIEKRNELDAKRTELANILSAARKGTGAQGEPIYDLNATQVEDVKRRQKEIEALGTQVTAMSADEAVKSWESRGVETPLPVGQHQGEERPKSFSEIFVSSPEYKAYRERKAGRMSLSVPVNLKTLFQTSAGLAPESTRSGVYSFFPTRPLAVMDFIPTVPWNQAVYKFIEETTYTNNAAEKAEGAAYAEAAFAYTERSQTVEKITNSLPVTDEQLDDVDGIQQILEDRLRFQILQRLDAQVLAGDGSTPNLKGTENVSGIQTQALGTDSTADAVFKLLRQIRDNGFAEPEVIFIAPSKWQTHRLAKTSDGIYLNGSPSERGPETMWGLPVVQTTAHTATKAIAGAYRAHSVLAVRSEIEVEVGYVNDDFSKGKKTIRAQMRAAMVHYRPKAFGNVTGL